MTKLRVLVLCFPYFRDNSIVTWGCSGFFEVIFVGGLVDTTHKNSCHFCCGVTWLQKNVYSLYHIYMSTPQHTQKKNKQMNKRSMAGTITREAKERPKDKQPTRTKKRKERASPSHGRKLFHSQLF
jgi:hypothetical protein